MASVAVAHVGPTFKEYAALAIFFYGVEATFEPDKIGPRLTPLHGDAVNSFGALSRTLHQFYAIRRRVCDTALDFDAENFETCVGGKQAGDLAESFVNSCEFWFAGAANRDDGASHFDGEANCTQGAE